jgi:site-specific DNA-methyltransferase (adenine-specific)
MSVQLFQGDCLEVMPTLAAGSVDLVLCDLPYGTTACKWDSIISFGALWTEYGRICSGAKVLTASQPFTSALITSNLAEFKYCWIWTKSCPSGFAHAKNMPLKNYEDVAVFHSGSVGHASQCKNRVPYNPQELVYAPHRTKNTKVRHKDESAFGNRPSHKPEYLQEFTNYPTQVIEFASASGVEHPTQKPVALMEYLIRTYTNPCDTVLDNCMGSGTTGVACVNTGRSFVGIEKDPNYFEIAQRRIRDAQEKAAV